MVRRHHLRTRCGGAAPRPIPPWNKPARPKAAPVKAPAKPAAEPPVHERGKEWEVVKLTGVRATRGRTAAGAPNYVYEVEWKGKYKNTYETRENLLAFAEEIKAIDQKCEVPTQLPHVNLAQVANAAAETAAKKKAEEREAALQKRKERLEREERAGGWCWLGRVSDVWDEPRRPGLSIGSRARCRARARFFSAFFGGRAVDEHCSEHVLNVRRAEHCFFML